MDRGKAEGACFYSGEKGHMANECSNKEVKSNHVRLSEKTHSSKGEYEVESDETEILNGENRIITIKRLWDTQRTKKALPGAQNLPSWEMVSQPEP